MSGGGSILKREHRKPTGKVGFISVFADGRPPQFHQVPFPPEKAAIERDWIAATVSTKNDLGRFYQLESEPEQNAEYGLDFTLRTSKGEECLELMEIAFLAKGSYDTAPLLYNHGELADAICDGIAKKSRRYGDRSTGIHLLLYSTDFRFNACNNVMWLVSKWCSSVSHAFDSVVYVSFIGPRSVDAKIVYPQPGRDYSRVDEDSVRDRRTLLGDITRIRPTLDGRGVEVPLGPPSEPFVTTQPDRRGAQNENSLNASSMKRPLEYLAKGLGISPTALWILLIVALLVWLALGAPLPQVGPIIAPGQ